MKTLDALSARHASEHIIFVAAARSFLHNQVRSMVGALKAAGEGKVSADDVQAMLESCERTQCPPLTPPEGLVFERVEY